MKFPISVEHIEDRIYLFLGEITKDFVENLRHIKDLPNTLVIRPSDGPELTTSIIFINGRYGTENYRIRSIVYTKTQFDKYEKSINYYKTKMGYDE